MSRQTSIRRRWKAARPIWSVKAASPSSRPGFFLKWVSRAAVAASSAEPVLAETSRSCQSRAGPAGSEGGASSSTTCALVPPRPKELTPARRGVGPSFHSASLEFYEEGSVREINPGIGPLEVQAGRKDFVLERENRFDQDLQRRPPHPDGPHWFLRSQSHKGFLPLLRQMPGSSRRFLWDHPTG